MYDPDVSLARQLVCRRVDKRDRAHHPQRPSVHPGSAIAAAIPLLAIACGIYAHVLQAHQLRDVAAQRAAVVPKVWTIDVTATRAPRLLNLPGSIAAEETASLQARASGYIERRYVDIGSRVKTGETLATIASPELSQQVARMRGSLAQAEANWKLAAATATRSAALLQRGWVSGQAWDRERLTEAARKAELDATRAALAEALQRESYLTVRAPFDGVVTARNVDTGDLVSSDTPTARALFVLDRADLLRIRVNVPQESAAEVKIGMGATISLPDSPERAFEGRVARTAGALSPVSRTMPVDIDVDNRDGAFVAGLYVIAHIAVPRAAPVTIVKAEALLQRSEGVFIATVGGAGTVMLHEVHIGRDFGSEVEILDGLPAKASVVLNPPAFLRDGMSVAVQTKTEKRI